MLNHISFGKGAKTLAILIPTKDLDKDLLIEYYIESEHEYYKWQSPVGAPNRLHSYYTGADTVKPVISIVTVANNLSTTAKFPIEVIVNDNFGVDAN